jgi:tyrosine-specific transport protein
VSGFSFFAITTSFVGFVLGLVDFLSDGLGFRAEESETKTREGNDWRPFLLTLAPPWAFALSYPDVFLDALDSAGTFGVLTLFGCMPPAMAWSNRYGGFGNANNAKGDKGDKGFEWKQNQSESESTARLLPGGKPALLLCFSLAAGVVLTESVQRVGYLLFDR